MCSAIEAHPLLTSDPAKNAPRALFFTWDFIRRTEFNLSRVNVPALVASDEVALEAYNDCLGRSHLFSMLIKDPVKCAMITQHEPVDFGAEVCARIADLESALKREWKFWMHRKEDRWMVWSGGWFTLWYVKRKLGSELELAPFSLFSYVSTSFRPESGYHD